MDLIGMWHDIDILGVFYTNGISFVLVSYGNWPPLCSLVGAV